MDAIALPRACQPGWEAARVGISPDESRLQRRPGAPCSRRLRSPFGTRRAPYRGVQSWSSQNQQFGVADRKKIPAATGKILPGRTAGYVNLLKWLGVFQVPAGQVPVVAPAGFRSPGVAGLGAVTRRSCKSRGPASPGSGTQPAPEVKHNRAELSLIVYTCETGEGTYRAGNLPSGAGCGSKEWQFPGRFHSRKRKVGEWI